MNEENRGSKQNEEEPDELHRKHSENEIEEGELK